MFESEGKNPESFDKTVSLEGVKGNHLSNLLDLSSDMKFLLQSSLMTDITLHVTGKYMLYCHKDILKFRSRWFSMAISEADAKGVDIIEIDEDIRTMKAVLYFIYTGDLRLLEYLNVCLMKIHEASRKYGFSRLEDIFRRIIIENEFRDVTKDIEFQWTLKIQNSNIAEVDCSAVNSFTCCGDDKWQLKIKSLSNDNDCSIGFCLVRKTEEPRTTAHKVSLDVSVIDCKGKSRFSLFEDLAFIEDGERLASKCIPLTELLKESNDLLSDDMITLACKLTFFARVGFLTKFRLRGSYRKYISNELTHLSYDMYKVLKDGKTQDVHFSQCYVKIHSYILLARSRIPTNFINELQERIGSEKQLWQWSFAIFLYTGQSRYLDNHARNVYVALSEMILTMARERYSMFLAKNLTLENAFHIMNDAVSYNDVNLASAAAHFLATKSNIESDPQMWVRIAHDKTSILKFIPQLYAFKQFL